MNRKKWLVSAVLATAMLMVTAGSVYAAKYEDPINGVELELDYELATGLKKDDIKVDCSTSGIDSVSVTSVTNTNYGKRPQVTIKVKADTSDGYYFDKEDASDIRSDGFWSLSGSEAEFKSGKRTSNNTATVTVQLPKIGGDDRSTLNVDNVSWEGDSGVVTWAAADAADSYTLRLYTGDSRKTMSASKERPPSTVPKTGQIPRSSRSRTKISTALTADIPAAVPAAAATPPAAAAAAPGLRMPTADGISTRTAPIPPTTGSRSTDTGSSSTREAM